MLSAWQDGIKVFGGPIGTTVLGAHPKVIIAEESTVVSLMKTLTTAKQHDLRRDRFLTATDAIVLERAVEITNTSMWDNALECRGVTLPRRETG